MRRMTFRMAPMAHSSIRTRIVHDRKRASVFACLAIVLIAAVFTVFLYVASFVTQYLGRFYFTVVASGTVFFCAVVARWNFEFVSARLIRQRIQAMWLRRFQAEGGRAFRTSRVVDRLARYGISTLTLQDRDVQAFFGTTSPTARADSLGAQHPAHDGPRACFLLALASRLQEYEC